MNTIIALIVFVLIVFIALLILKQNTNTNTNTNTQNIDESLMDNMEEQFNSELSKGDNAIRIASIYHQYDIMLIKSLFNSEKIPYYFEFENMSKIKAGLPINSINNVYINVLEKDKSDAIAIIEDYLQSKNKDESENKNKARNIAEVVLMGNTMPSPNNSRIDIYK